MVLIGNSGEHGSSMSRSRLANGALASVTKMRVMAIVRAIEQQLRMELVAFSTSFDDQEDTITFTDNGYPYTSAAVCQHRCRSVVVPVWWLHDCSNSKSSSPGAIPSWLYVPAQLANSTCACV